MFGILSRRDLSCRKSAIADMIGEGRTRGEEGQQQGHSVYRYSIRKKIEPDEKKLVYEIGPNFCPIHYTVVWQVLKSGVHRIQRTTMGMQKITPKSQPFFLRTPQSLPIFRKISFFC